MSYRAWRWNSMPWFVNLKPELQRAGWLKSAGVAR
jgi:hypothetical protein